MALRRFPPPWSVEEYNDACFIVRDNDGQQLAYVYFEEEPGRRASIDNAAVDRIFVMFVPVAVEIYGLRDRLFP